MQKILKFVLKGNYDYSRTHRLVEIIGIVLFFMYTGLIFYKLFFLEKTYNPYTENGFILSLVFILILAYLAADFVSGFVHFLGDNFGSEETPVLGKGFVKPFRDHHVDPKKMTRYDWIGTNGNNSIVSLLVLIPFYYLTSIETSYSSYLWAYFVVLLLVFVLLTNQFHKWAHMENLPKWVKFSQRLGLFLSPKHHEVHHKSPFDTYYCITSGWLNPLLRRIRFFEATAFVLRIFFKQAK